MNPPKEWHIFAIYKIQIFQKLEHQIVLRKAWYIIVLSLLPLVYLHPKVRAIKSSACFL